MSFNKVKTINQNDCGTFGGGGPPIYDRGTPIFGSPVIGVGYNSDLYVVVGA